MLVKSTENFLEIFEKAFSPKKEDLLEYSNLILSFIFKKFFGMKMFSKASRKFSGDFTSMFKVSERSA